MQPLVGIKVVDFSTLLPGPLASLILAEAGALVIKIERPGEGDELRRYEPRLGADGAAFALLNRGKCSVAIDLKADGAKARLMPLLVGADVLIEQFRPGVMARLGLGYEALAAINPRLIYCSITGYGQRGPKVQVAAHDLDDAYVAAQAGNSVPTLRTTYQGPISAGANGSFAADLELYYDEVVPPEHQRRVVTVDVLEGHQRQMVKLATAAMTGEQASAEELMQALTQLNAAPIRTVASASLRRREAAVAS